MTDAIKKFREKMEEANNQLDLARMYLDDGAQASAARCYHRAADLLKTAAEIKAKAFSS